MLGLFGCGSASAIRGATLEKYSYSSSGGMTGGGDREEIVYVGEDVILTYASRQWYYEDDEIVEYKVDPAVLEEIEEIFRKYRMYNWESKKFSNIFVADGPNYSYSFKFDNSEYISFSSQSYPAKYGDKLREISEVINKYRESGTVEPGLIKEPQTGEDFQNNNHPEDGVIKIEVYEYSGAYVKVRIMNGTDEIVEIMDDKQIIRQSDNEVIYEYESTYPNTIYNNSSEELYVKIPYRLEVGKYTVHVADYTTEFEIGYK